MSDPKIIHTADELAALDPDTVLMGDEAILLTAADCVENSGYPLYDNDRLAVVATGEQVRAARQALEATDNLWDLPSHRTEAGYPNCSTCDGGGCPDCTDPA